MSFFGGGERCHFAREVFFRLHFISLGRVISEAVINGEGQIVLVIEAKHRVQALYCILPAGSDENGNYQQWKPYCE
jgi:hypothetical protein